MKFELEVHFCLQILNLIGLKHQKEIVLGIKISKNLLNVSKSIGFKTSH